MTRFPWISAALVGAGLVVALLPQLAESLQYERAAVENGAYWRLLTGQLAHWTPRMAAIDLLVTLAAGAWLEMRSRRLLLGVLVSAGLLVAGTLYFWTASLTSYRGSSGIASGLFVAMAILVATGPAPAAMRGVAWICLAGFTAKAFWEALGGAPLFAGQLPDGVAVAPAVHLAGALGAAICVGVRPEKYLVRLGKWYARRDSNSRPSGSKPDALSS